MIEHILTNVFNTIAVVCAILSVFFAVATWRMNRQTRKIYERMRKP